MEIIEFFTKVTGFIPTSDQEKFLKALTDLSMKNVIACAGRQTGKSLCSAVAVLWWIFEYPEQVEVLLMSTMDSYVYDHIEKLFAKNPEFSAEIVQEGVAGLVPLRGFQVKKGSRVHVRRGTERQIRGLGVDILIGDEAAELPDKLITTAMGNMRGNIQKIILLSTPHKTGMFTKLVCNPDEFHYQVFNWSELNCTWHTPEELENKKKLMSNQDYKMEVLGQVLSAEERAYFPSKHLDACIYPDVVREGSPQSTIEVGIDFGFESPTVMVITEKIFSRRRVLFVKSWKRQPIENFTPDVAEILERFKPNIVKADFRPPEYHGQIEKHWKTGIIHYIDAVYSKDEQLAQLQRKIRQHTLEIPEAQLDLITQLRKYRKKMRTGDDHVDALALSCYEPSTPLSTKPSGKVIF